MNSGFPWKNDTGESGSRSKNEKKHIFLKFLQQGPKFLESYVWNSEENFEKNMEIGKKVNGTEFRKLKIESFNFYNQKIRISKKNF